MSDATCEDLGWTSKNYIKGPDGVCAATGKYGLGEKKCPSATYAEIDAICDGFGARLCSAAELQEGAAFGCDTTSRCAHACCPPASAVVRRRPHDSLCTSSLPQSPP